MPEENVITDIETALKQKLEDPGVVSLNVICDIRIDPESGCSAETAECQARTDLKSLLKQLGSPLESFDVDSVLSVEEDCDDLCEDEAPHRRV